MKMLRYVYVDTENVDNDAWLPGLCKLTEADTLYLIYTHKSQRVAIEYLPYILKCKADVKFIQAENGTPNALDFVLVCVLSKQVYSARKSLHWVVSGDKGFDSAVNFLCKQGFHVERSPILTNIRRSDKEM